MQPFIWILIPIFTPKTMILAQVAGAAFGLLAVILGAFGAHALKKRFTPDQQISFETGVRYQLFHSVVLLVIGFAPATAIASTLTAKLFIAGTVLFSFSIYGLCLTGAFGRKWRFLGPVTPLGGLLLVAGWIALLVDILGAADPSTQITN